MGLFDTVYGENRKGQVKCFGPCLTSYEIGSEVTLIRNPEQIFDMEGVIPTGVMPDRDYQIAMSDGSFLTVEEGRLKNWDEVRRGGLPLYNTHGYEWDGSPRLAGAVVDY